MVAEALMTTDSSPTLSDAPMTEPKGTPMIPQAEAQSRNEATAPGVPAAIELQNVTQRFHAPGGKGTFTALNGVSLTVGHGEFVSLVGPSGCGKSSLLWIIAGLATQHSGSVNVLGKPVKGVNKEVGIIIQQDALLPWRSARENVALPLRFRGVPKREAAKRADEWLARVGLRGFESSYPHQLSGGMRKRVGVGATLAFEPKVLLLDEPFSALDVQTRNLMENDLLDLWTGSGQSVLFITHDLDEAVGLSDRVIVMTSSPGTVLSEHPVELARPRDLLEDRRQLDFVRVYGEIWEGLRNEVMKAHQDQSGASAILPGRAGGLRH
jgi:NitT/TauT family transport system ATP-binding protein